MKAWCMDFMPVQGGPGALYRWTPLDTLNITGWSNISGVVDSFALGTNIVLLNAYTVCAKLSLSVAIILTI